MPKIDVVDEAVIDGSPAVVYQALFNEISGVTNWWMPHLKCKVTGEMPLDRMGATFDIIVNPNSRMNAKFCATVTKVVKDKSIEEKYTGDFVGTGKWTFEPIDGKTKVQFQWAVKTNRLLLSIFSPFVDFGKRHSDVTQKGFKALNSYLNKK